MKLVQAGVRSRASRFAPVGAALALAVVAAGSLASPAEGQILDRIRERVDQGRQVAEEVGALVVPVSTEQEVTIGRGIAAVVAGRYGVSRDEALTRYVNLVGAALASVAPRPGVAYRFAVLDSDEINAFAAPGGYIFVTRGALGLMDDEATLAGVLAHEIGHVDARDVVEEIQSKARTAWGIEQAAEEVDVAGEEYLRMAVEAGAGALFMGLSREDELEADGFAVRRASAAGYDPAGIRRFVEKLEDREDDENVSFLKKTHPDPDDRLDNIDRALRSLPREATKVLASERFRRHVPGG
jgi:predicted Zn-dependent protease